MGQRFEDLFLPHLGAAYNLARFLVRDTAAADDIVQESFLRAFRSFATYRGGDAKTWLLAIVRNCSFDWTKSNRRMAASEVAVGSDESAWAAAADDSGPGGGLPDRGDWPVAAEDPQATLLRETEVAALRAMIQRLPEPFRETLVLRELEELSYRQIAELMGAPVGTVMSRLARARRMLTAELEQAR